MNSKTFLFTTAIITATTAAFGAASLRAPTKKISSDTIATPTTARAGTLRAPTMKTSSVSTPSTTTTQSIATPVSTETTDARIALLKGIKGFNPGKIKDTAAAQQELNNINSQIEELQAQLDRAEAAQSTVLTTTNVDDKITASVESKTYTKAEIDNLLSNVIKKLPQLDDKGNMTWTDPNGNLVVVHVGDVVIGGDDIIIVDGNLSTTSTHPVQNKVVTNALNEKQDQSTTLSFGNADGGWSPVVSGDNYIEIYADSTNMNTGATTTGLRLKPIMIVNNLDNIANENQLVTATAVKNALDALTTNPGGGTQPDPYFNLIYLETRYDSLVSRYTYNTNASYNQILEFATEFCGGPFSEKWCWLEYYGDSFLIIKRTEGYYLQDYDIGGPYFGTDGNIYIDLSKTYQLNLPDGIGLTTYVQENLCAIRDTTCHIDTVLYNFDNSATANQQQKAIYTIQMRQAILYNN